jgi:predicted solute-binding protein
MALSALADLRIGSVPYLNAKPLVWGLDPSRVVFEIPAVLSGSYERGEVDIALLPLFEVLQLGGGAIADDIAVACRGEVLSVFVASREESFPDIAQISLDPASRSSVALTKVLLDEFYPNGPRVISDDPGESGARLLIGDPALEFRQTHREGWHYHDLGLLWQKHTGLPFVFAAWAFHKDLANPTEVAQSLRDIKQVGLEARAIIARNEPDPAVALAYLTENIRYHVGPDEKKAIALFSQLAAKHGLIEKVAEIRYY